MHQPLEERILYETITTIETSIGCHATPLGVYVKNCYTLLAWIYPGTLLHKTSIGRCAVITFPRDVLDFARLLLGEHRLWHMGYCCPIAAEPYIIVEAVIEEHRVEPDGKILLRLRPTHLTIHEPPKPFSRLDSCIIEVLIAYTRIAFFPDCTSKLNELASIKRCIDLLDRRAEGEHRILYMRVKDRILEALKECRGGYTAG